MDILNQILIGAFVVIALQVFILLKLYKVKDIVKNFLKQIYYKFNDILSKFDKNVNILEKQLDKSNSVKQSNEFNNDIAVKIDSLIESVNDLTDKVDSVSEELDELKFNNNDDDDDDYEKVPIKKVIEDKVKITDKMFKSMTKLPVKNYNGGKDYVYYIAPTGKVFLNRQTYNATYTIRINDRVNYYLVDDDYSFNTDKDSNAFIKYIPEGDLYVALLSKNYVFQRIFAGEFKKAASLNNMEYFQIVKCPK